MEKENVFEKNMQAIMDIFPKMAGQIEAYMQQAEDMEEVWLDKSVQNEDILAVKENGRLWYLNSRYCAGERARRWVNQYKDKNYETIFIVYGLAEGTHIRELMKETREHNFILVYEPKTAIFLTVLRNLDISDIIRSQRIFIAVEGINTELIYEFVSEAIDYGKIRLVEYCSLPNYICLYPQEWADLIKIIKSQFEVLILDRNTQISFSKEFILNMLENFDDMPKQYAINQLKETFDRYDLTDIPAIIVSAGPSLDKNVSELKRAVGKAFIIVTDTAIKSVLRAGVIPDIAVTIDPHKNPYLFAHRSVVNIPMLVCQHSNKCLMNIHNGKRFYFGDDNSFVNDIYERFAGIGIAPLETGGSVANNSFSLAQYCGFQTIILIGQDLAFTGKRIHASAAYDGGSYDEMEADGKYVEVEDIYGGTVQTDKSMEMYLKWFEKQIVRYPELKVIDATEGGAKIHGTEIIRFRDAIDRECKGELDIAGIINGIKPAFSESAREAVYTEYTALPERYLEFKKRINRGIRDYKRLAELFRLNKTSSSEYKKCVKGIEQINYEIEHTPCMELAAIYNRKTEYEIRENVYQVYDSQSEEIKHIVDSGIKLLDSYKEAIDKLLEDIEQKGKVNMRELYEQLASARVYMSRVVSHYRAEKYNSGNTYLNSLIKNLVNAIDSLNRFVKMENKPFEIDYGMFNIMLSDILKAQEDMDYIYLADLLEEKYISFICEILIQMAAKGLIPWEEYENENLEIVRQRYPELYEELIKIDTINEDKYKAVITCSGEVAIRIHDRITYSSTVDSFMSGEQKFYESFDNQVSEYTFVGLNLPWLEAMYSLGRGTRVTVFEHDIYMIKLILKYNKMRTLLQCQDYQIVYDRDFSKLSEHLKHMTGNLWIHKPCIANIENPEIRNVLRLAFTSVNSIQTQRKMLEKNFIGNLLAGAKTIDEISSAFKGKNMIYIAGGPSLDYDMETLKKASDDKQYILVAAGTVAKKLLGKKIIPDYIILSDCKDSIIEQIKGIDEREMKQIGLLYLSTVSAAVVEIWKGKKYMLLQMDFDKAEIYAGNIGATLFETGGSVSTLAVDMAVRLKCGSLICVGLDLAYTNGKIHASECKSYEEGEAGNQNQRIVISSVDGLELQTTAVYEIYRKFIESRISRPDAGMDIYNTAKGAYIKGMKHARLEELV